MNNNPKTVIAERSFSASEQQLFASFSGDFNPIHLNPVYARRTIAGQCVVYGVYAVMWALDTFLSIEAQAPSSIRVNFLKPIFLDESVSCFWDAKNKKLEICDNSVVLTEIVLSFDKNITPFLVDLRHGPVFKTPLDRDLDAIKIRETQDLYFRGEGKLATTMFRCLSSVYSNETCCEIATISEVIGMQVPGLHSMLLSLDIAFAYQDCIPSFSVKDVHEKFNILRLAIDGQSLSSEVKALLRPKSPQGISLLSYKHKVKPLEFEAVRALIIGGSRGLGECVAKLIALGGGETVITYALGHEDALQVAGDIGDHGSKSSAIKFRVPDDVHRLDDLGEFNQVYYFATPKIFSKRGVNYDENTYLTFQHIYVEGFKRIVEHFKSCERKIAIYYPSSIAISEPIPELAEYIKAKKEGEQLCKEMNDFATTIIIHSRVPRTETDQTVAVIDLKAEKPENVMLPIVRRMASVI